MKIVKTRKVHTCDYCRKDIPKGTEAQVEKRLWRRTSGQGSYWETYYFHKTCPRILPHELRI